MPVSHPWLRQDEAPVDPVDDGLLQAMGHSQFQLTLLQQDAVDDGFDGVVLAPVESRAARRDR